jgi:hypothetical protein
LTEPNLVSRRVSEAGREQTVWGESAMVAKVNKPSLAGGEKRSVHQIII